MGDDWDDVVTTAPARGSSGVSWNDNNNTGVKPPAGRGRGTATITNQMSNVKVSEDEWGEPVKAASTSNGWDAPAKTTESSNGWGAPKTSAASSDDWGTPKTSQFNDADDQPRGGGWGSSGGGGGGGFKGVGGGSRACHKVCINIGHIFFITNCSNLVSTGRTHGKRLS
jgi:hypothetical protein